MKAIFILGKGRSGTTLLDNILDEVPGVVSVGELRYLWTWGTQRGVLCGCGRPLDACAVWGPVLTDIPGDPAEHAARTDRVLRWRNARRVLRGRRWPDLDRWCATMAAVYDAVARVTGATVIVDSSKVPFYPPALGLVEGVEPAVAHLVRDPRAVANSWRRTKRWTDRPSGDMPRYPSVHTAVSWTVRALLAERVAARAGPDRSTTIRYEDLVADPSAAVRRVLGLAGVGSVPLPFIDGHRVALTPNHTVGGNPDRMDRRSVDITPDESWRDELGRFDRALTSALTWPVRRRFGYGGGSPPADANA